MDIPTPRRILDNIKPTPATIQILEYLGLGAIARRGQSHAALNAAAPLQGLQSVETDESIDRPYRMLEHYVEEQAYEESVETGFMVEQIIMALRKVSGNNASKMVVLATVQIHLHELDLLEQLRDELIINISIPQPRQRSDD